MNDQAFLERFEASAFPSDQWRHQHHIKIAYLYLLLYPFDAAMTRLREKIQALNRFHQVPDLPTRGYHETVTQAWLRLVQTTLLEYGSAESADAFYERHPQLSHKSVLRLFYSRELLTSPKAKLEFVEPDLAPLPHSRKEAHPVDASRHT